MKKIPWLSLILLLTAYSTLSWSLYRTTAPWLVWLVVVFLSLGQALLLTTFSRGFRIFIKKWLQSDIGYFSVISLGAFSIAVFLVWFHVFEFFLLVVGAEILARLDLQSAGFDEWQALGVLTFISCFGLAVGWTARVMFNV